MPLSCHRVLKEVKEKTDLTVAIAGNPNVGKSCLFNQLTGLNVITANYPGKTVELNFGVTKHNDTTIGIIDLPGTYAISAISEDQWVARRGVLEGRPEVAIVVVDASNLQRNLYLGLQFLELGLSVVVALNLIDYAAKIGLKIDHEALSKLLGAPVVPTVAVRGEGVRELIQTVVDLAHGKLKTSKPSITYGRDIEAAIEELETTIIKNLQETPYGLPPRALAIQLLEGDPEFIEVVKGYPNGEQILQLSTTLAKQIEAKHGEPAGIRIVRERYGLAGTIADAVQSRVEQPILFSERLKHYTVAPLTGMPLMLVTLFGVFTFMFYVGGFLGDTIGSLWGSLISPLLDRMIYLFFTNKTLARIIIWGFDAGILAWLSVGVPYVLTFYFVLSILEDSGYLNSVAFLTDNIMHRFGLHGRAIIPIITGAGCNVPAIMGTRVLTTKRERFLACTLIVLVPCSARIAVILAAVAHFIGWSYVALIFIIDVALICIVGFGLHKLLPGESSGLVMEMFPLRIPSGSAVLKKTWYRFRDFVFMAAPIVMLGSLVLGALYETGYLWALTNSMKPFVQWLLGLPAVTVPTLIFGILRKELTLQLLVALAIMQYGPSANNLLIFMTPTQLFIFALVVTIYIPCVATVAVLGKELGWKTAFLIMPLTIVLALLIGAVAYHLISFLGIG